MVVEVAIDPPIQFPREGEQALQRHVGMPNHRAPKFDQPRVAGAHRPIHGLVDPVPAGAWDSPGGLHPPPPRVQCNTMTVFFRKPTNFSLHCNPSMPTLLRQVAVSRAFRRMSTQSSIPLRR
uniref:Uncharacterized protein n=1 Tax=Eutreptiella gymnastica TaxID=73025 RepID=A0A7S4LJD8_9EUGL